MNLNKDDLFMISKIEDSSNEYEDIQITMMKKSMERPHPLDVFCDEALFQCVCTDFDNAPILATLVWTNYISYQPVIGRMFLVSQEKFRIIPANPNMAKLINEEITRKRQEYQGMVNEFFVSPQLTQKTRNEK